MRDAPAGPCGSRNSALWGNGKTGRRARALLLGAAAALSICLSGGGQVSAAAPRACVSAGLRDSAAAQPDRTFRVIVQGHPGHGDVASAVAAELPRHSGKGRGLTRRLVSIDAVAAELTGAQVEELAADGSVSAITEDAPVRAARAYSNYQVWPSSAGVTSSWGPTKATFPAIAVVDSGIDATKTDFGTRIVAQASFVSGGGNSPGDGPGHGTFVAGIAAGDDSGYTGAQPRAKLVSLDVLDDKGSGYTSDVIAATDWIIQNKARYNIRVANFSLNGGSPTSSLRWDPLDKAVEKLWLNGVVVVVAAGNYGTGSGPSGVLFAPANDPFVITVGASDVNGTSSTSDDFAAPWSAYGYTSDGFLKPELAAPGRVLNGPVPTNSTMLLEHPERVIAPGRMWMSGTSFAAPVVAGAAAWLLADHPTWTPDQVKGALMAGAASPSGYTAGGALGVGVVNAARADALSGVANPNAALDQFVVTTNDGLQAFDAASWASAASANSSWDAASWSSASWYEASWSSASWSDASWASASWASASWASASWSSASWNEASWDSLLWLP